MKGGIRSGTYQKARSLKERLADEGVSIDEDTAFQPRPTEGTSNRYLLANALENTSQPNVEQQYREQNKTAKDLEERLDQRTFEESLCTKSKSGFPCLPHFPSLLAAGSGFSYFCIITSFFEKTQKTIDKYVPHCYNVKAVWQQTEYGGIAQLGERLNGIQEVSGSIPLISTTES